MSFATPLRLSVRRMDWPFQSPFRISNRVREHAETIIVELTDDSLTGRGEASGVSYHGESADALAKQVQALEPALLRGTTRDELGTLIPAGGARSALDAALWDYEAKRSDRRAWDLAGLPSARPLATSYTLSLDTPEAMGNAARAALKYKTLKLKLGGEGDVDRVKAVKRVRPDATLIADSNQAWDERQLFEFLPAFADLGVALLEQPLPIEEDSCLAGLKSPIPICADESCQTVESLPMLRNKYQYINIKLDKTGGLTEALCLAEAARREGLKLMMGCMAGSSLSIAPAFVAGQLCDIVDLDFPLLLSSDIANGITYEADNMAQPKRELWG
jgi:L-alanine-DL-glutamate epimerase-like enolase superfamily enzyme